MKGFTLRLATLDRHVPDWCATHFSYSLEKMRERANVELRVPGRVFWKPHTMTNLKEVKKTNNPNQGSLAIFKRAGASLLQTQIPMSLATILL